MRYLSELMVMGEYASSVSTATASFSIRAPCGRDPRLLRPLHRVVNDVARP